MRTLLIASTASYSGKSGIALACIRAFIERGLDTGYFKPYGVMPVTVDGVLTDQDATYLNETLGRPAPLEAVCPVVRTQAFVEDVLAHRTEDLRATVHDAFAVCSKGRDAIVIEGPSDLIQGSGIGLSVTDVAEILDAHVLLLHKPGTTPDIPDAVICESRRIGGRLLGVVLTWVQEASEDFISRRIVPFLASEGIPVLGVMPYDVRLASVTVSEIVDALGGTILCAEDRVDEPVESFMVGAMGQEKALRFFRRKANKAVITGGDRSDVQLAALETSTRAIVLTGNMPPSSIVLARAEELGVPMILVDADTLTAVERMETLMGRTRLHDEAKAGRIRALFEQAVDVDELLAALDARS